jgi:hypothetical protein
MWKNEYPFHPGPAAALTANDSPGNRSIAPNEPEFHSRRCQHTPFFSTVGSIPAIRHGESLPRRCERSILIRTVGFWARQSNSHCCIPTCGARLSGNGLGSFTGPPHSVQVSISMSPKAPTFGEDTLQARRLYALRVQVRDARRSTDVGGSWDTLALLPLPRFAGVTNARCLLFGANTP